MPFKAGRRVNRPAVRIAHLALAAALAGTAWITTAAPSEAADLRSPRIVAAAMRDADGDGRADRVRLTYSERVRHPADRDGRYPFRVAGYRIEAVGKAKGRKLAVRLVEASAPDDGARPAVRYERTRAQKVVDRARNQAVRQAFRGTLAHANRPATPQPQTPAPTPQAPAPPAPSTDPDRDADGTPDAKDCAPGDPAVHPGAPDTPDLSFLDSNCDGIDGDVNGAIFVSLQGDDANAGTRAAPKREIYRAIVAAGLEGKDVYVAGGDYLRVETVSGVDIYGGYHATTIPDEAGASFYAIRGVAGAKLTLQAVTLLPGAGKDGSHGADGANGEHGGDGGDGETGSCDTEVGGFGGPGGASPAGRPGGSGGRGGLERLDRDGGAGGNGAFGSLGGAGGLNGNPGKTGLRGADGDNGASGRQGHGGADQLAFASETWSGGFGSPGTSGQPGDGGGGGGGGGGQKGAFVVDGVGNAGGGGGGGGGGGIAGSAGRPGGGSFGLYLHNASATLSHGSTIRTGDGGKGGNGGRAGSPGLGGASGKGARHCLSELGAGGNGGAGGMGGFGGGGGGGAGGPSIGVMQAGQSSATLLDVDIQVGSPGAPGAPGAGGSGGTPAAQGLAAAVFPQPAVARRAWR